MKTYPDIHCTIEDLLADGDKVTTRWATQGTYHGQQPGDPADAKKVEFQAISIYRFLEGRVIENWDTIIEIREESEAQNKAAARRFYDEVWNNRNLSALDEILAPNVIRHNAVLADREAYREFIVEALKKQSRYAFHDRGCDRKWGQGGDPLDLARHQHRTPC